MHENIKYETKTATDREEAISELIEDIYRPFTEKKSGVALVGLGKYSSGQLAPALLETKLCHLAGIVTGTESKITDWKVKYNIPDKNIYSYENFDEICNNEDISILYIVLPNALHAEYVIRGAKAGKHIICEKPMGLSVKECDEMIKACKDAGKLLSIGYRLHFEPHHLYVMKMGQEKIFGELTHVHAKHGSNDTDGWRLNKKLAGGGPLMDLGIYCIQAARYTSGMEPVAVTAREGKKTKPELFDEIEESLSWEMEFADGLRAVCETSYAEEMNLLHADAVHGWFELSPAYEYEGITGKTATGFINLPQVNQQALQMDSFAHAILTNGDVKVPGEMGRTDVKIIEAVYEAMRTGKRIEIRNDY
ncbi:MAG: Gfo/Idh/MocA family protein [Chitinophagaceae bacterium]